MRILLADDQPAVRGALRLLLELQFAPKMIVEVADTAHLLAQIVSIKPDLVLLDWELPGPASPDLLQVLRSYVPHLKIIVLSSRPEAQKNALAAGSDAFVSKGSPPEQLVTALNGLARNSNSRRNV